MSGTDVTRRQKMLLCKCKWARHQDGRWHHKLTEASSAGSRLDALPSQPDSVMSGLHMHEVVAVQLLGFHARCCMVQVSLLMCGISFCCAPPDAAASDFTAKTPQLEVLPANDMLLSSSKGSAAAHLSELMLVANCCSYLHE